MIEQNVLHRLIFSPLLGLQGLYCGSTVFMLFHWPGREPGILEQFVREKLVQVKQGAGVARPGKGKMRFTLSEPL